MTAQVLSAASTAVTSASATVIKRMQAPSSRFLGLGAGARKSRFPPFLLFFIGIPLPSEKIVVSCGGNLPGHPGMIYHKTRSRVNFHAPFSRLFTAAAISPIRPVR